MRKITKNTKTILRASEKIISVALLGGFAFRYIYEHIADPTVAYVVAAGFVFYAIKTVLK